MTYMKYAAFGVALLAAGQASALSCMAPEVELSYLKAAEADEAYVVLNGVFSFPQPPKSETGDINAPREVTYVAAFAGEGLGAAGFGPVPDLEVTVTHGCLAAWCGSLPADVPVLAFVETRADGYYLTVGPCGGEAFAEPTRAMVRQVEAMSRR